MNKPKRRPPSTPECDVQSAIVGALRVSGFTVLQTNLAKARVICDPGVPDLIVSSDAWPYAMWLGLEVKNETGRLSDEQAALYAAHRIEVVRSIDDALGFVKKAHEAIIRECLEAAS